MPFTAQETSRPAVWVWAIASLLLGIVYLIATPPFAAPDEIPHFYRAWYVSTGHFTAAIQEGVPGVYIPEEVRRLPETFAWDFAASKFPSGRIGPALRASATTGEPRFLALASHSYSSGLGYLPQALGIALGRAFHASPAGCFYLGRFSNLIAGILLIGLAIRWFPAYRWLVLILALTPMACHVRSSLSLDVTALGLSFLFIALVTRALFLDERPISARLWTAIAIVGGLLCMTKINYIPIVALALAVQTRRFRTPRAAWAARGALVLAGGIGAAIGTAVATMYYAPYRSGVHIDPQLQMKLILEHPLRFLGILKLEYVSHAKWYLVSLVGDLGSGEFIVVLPKLLIVFYLAAMLFLLAVDTNPQLKIAPWQRVWFAILCAGATLAVALAIYTTWNPVGWDHIDGLQGRYYMPFLPAAAFIVHQTAARLRQSMRMTVALAVMIVSHPIALWAMTHRWYAR